MIGKIVDSLQHALAQNKLERESLEASLKALQRTTLTGDAKVGGNALGNSVRIGVLHILKDNPEQALAPKQLAEMLRDKGYGTHNKNLQSSLGATLSIMLNQRKEIKKGPQGSGYMISAGGLKNLEQMSKDAVVTA